MTCPNCNEEIMRNEIELCRICRGEFCEHCIQEHEMECGFQNQEEEKILDEIHNSMLKHD